MVYWVVFEIGWLGSFFVIGYCCCVGVMFSCLGIDSKKDVLRCFFFECGGSEIVYFFS